MMCYEVNRAELGICYGKKKKTSILLNGVRRYKSFRKTNFEWNYFRNTHSLTVTKKVMHKIYLTLKLKALCNIEIFKVL